MLFSGGQDSTIALFYALTNYAYVETVGFNYGQRHDVELDCRLNVLARLRSDFPKLASKLGPDHLLNMSTFAKITQSGLTERDKKITSPPGELPTSFVPGRNLFFFSYAAVIGYNNNLGSLIGGMCETDYSGYPDCRDEVLRHLQTTLNEGMAADMEIVTPLMWASKAESWQMAHDLGGDAAVRLIVEESHSCYYGVREALYEWGYGCGNCPACLLRAKGFNDWQKTLADGVAS